MKYSIFQKFKNSYLLKLMLFLVLFFNLNVFGQVLSSNMKWNPGHYLLTTLEGSKLEELLNSFKDIQSLRGIQKSYYWSHLEPSKDSYDFSLIERDLVIAKKYGKKLSIIIGYKYQISSTQSSLPNYILNLPNALVNGIYVPSYFVQGKAGDGPYNQGHHANFGHPGTLSGFSKLLKALGTKYDSNLDISHLQFIETSLGSDPGATQVEVFLDGIEKMETAAKVAFATTPIFQNLNYPRSRLAGFINNLTVNKMGFGGPDVFIGSFDEPNNGLTYDGANKGIYLYNESNYNSLTKNNVLPIGMQVHGENFLYETMDLRLAGIKTSKTPDEMVSAIFDFAVNRLHSNYIMWQVYNIDPYKPALVKLLLAHQNLNPNKMGGVIESCPSNFSSCAGSLTSDNEKPTVAITSPANNSVNIGSVNIDVAANDNIGISRVELYANDVLFNTLTNSPFIFTYSNSSTNDVLVNFRARAYDKTGNFQDSIGVQTLIESPFDSIGPNISISNPNDGDVIPSWKSSIWIVSSASDKSGIKNIKLYINGTLIKATYGIEKLNYEWNLNRVKAGYYQIKIISIDNLGNPSSKSIKIQVQ